MRLAVPGVVGSDDALADTEEPVCVLVAFLPHPRFPAALAIFFRRADERLAARALHAASRSSVVMDRRATSPIPRPPWFLLSFLGHINAGKKHAPMIPALQSAQPTWAA